MKNHHVNMNFTYDFPTFGEAADVFLGICLLIFLIFGFIGNIIALCHFRSQQTCRNIELFNSLYIAVSTIDICTCSINFPVIYSLLYNRLPGLFSISVFCTFWTILFNYLQKISMYLVMLLTVTRAIRVIYGNYQVSVSGIIGSFIGYSLLAVSLDLIVYLIADSDMSYYYSSDAVYCYEYVYEGGRLEYGTFYSSVMVINNIKFVVQVGIPPIIIFISFLICSFKLRQLLSVTKQRRFSTKIYTNALKTTTFFTSLFILCNLPFFVLKVLETVTTFHHEVYPGPFFDNSVMFWYSWLIAKIHFTVINACMNPLLYYWRISAFKSAMNESYRDLSRRFNESSRSVTSP